MANLMHALFYVSYKMRYKTDGICKGNVQNSCKVFGYLFSDTEHQKSLELSVIFVIKENSRWDYESRM